MLCSSERMTMKLGCAASAASMAHTCCATSRSRRWTRCRTRRIGSSRTPTGRARIGCVRNLGRKVDVRPQVYGHGARDLSHRRRRARAARVAQGEGAEACGRSAECGTAGSRASLKSRGASRLTHRTVGAALLGRPAWDSVSRHPDRRYIERSHSTPGGHGGTPLPNDPRFKLNVTISDPHRVIHN